MRELRPKQHEQVEEEIESSKSQIQKIRNNQNKAILVLDIQKRKKMLKNLPVILVGIPKIAEKLILCLFSSFVWQSARMCATKAKHRIWFFIRARESRCQSAAHSHWLSWIHVADKSEPIRILRLRIDDVELFLVYISNVL